MLSSPVPPVTLSSPVPPRISSPPPLPQIVSSPLLALELVALGPAVHVVVAGRRRDRVRVVAAPACRSPSAVAVEVEVLVAQELVDAAVARDRVVAVRRRSSVSVEVAAGSSGPADMMSSPAWPYIVVAAGAAVHRVVAGAAEHVRRRRRCRRRCCRPRCRRRSCPRRRPVISLSLPAPPVMSSLPWPEVISSLSPSPSASTFGSNSVNATVRRPAWPGCRRVAVPSLPPPARKEKLSSPLWPCASTTASRRARPGVFRYSSSLIPKRGDREARLAAFAPVVTSSICRTMSFSSSISSSRCFVRLVSLRRCRRR